MQNAKCKMQNAKCKMQNAKNVRRKSPCLLVSRSPCLPTPNTQHPTPNAQHPSHTPAEPHAARGLHPDPQVEHGVGEQREQPRLRRVGGDLIGASADEAFLRPLAEL